MKKINTLCVFLILSCLMSTLCAMQSKPMHIPRKKPGKRLKSSLEKHHEHLMHDWDDSDPFEPPQVHARKGKKEQRESIELPMLRRSSTGQINRSEKRTEQARPFSPRLKRENSKGSIPLNNDNKWLILARMKSEQDTAHEEIRKKENRERKEQKKEPYRPKDIKRLSFKRQFARSHVLRDNKHKSH